MDLKGAAVNDDVDEGVAAACPAIRSLDLSATLVSDMHALAGIARQLPRLAVLRIRCRRVNAGPA